MGAAYVPVPADQPASRRDSLVNLSGGRIALTNIVDGWPAGITAVPLSRALTGQELPGPAEMTADELRLRDIHVRVHRPAQGGGNHPCCGHEHHR